MALDFPTSDGPTLVLLAAGVGKRYGGTKQLDPLGPDGELLLEYSIYDALRAGFGRVVLVVRPAAEDLFRERLKFGAERAVPIVYAHQHEPEGTGHALLCARHAIEDPFAVANADDVYGAGSFQALARALERDAFGWVMVGFQLNRTLSPHGPVSRALCRLTPEGTLLSLDEQLEVVSGDALVSMNLWGLPPEALDAIEERYQAHACDEEFRLPTAIGDLVAAGRATVNVIPSSEDWLGITWAEDRTWVRHRLARLTQAGRYPSPLWRDA